MAPGDQALAEKGLGWFGPRHLLLSRHSTAVQPAAGHCHQEGFNARIHPRPKPEPGHSSMNSCPVKLNTSLSVKCSSYRP